MSSTEGNFAVNIKSTRVKQRSFVEAMKGDFGFLSYEVEEGKKLFFHVTEVEAGDVLLQGDEVEFVVATNKRNGKHSACCVRKIRCVDAYFVPVFLKILIHSRTAYFLELPSRELYILIPYSLE